MEEKVTLVVGRGMPSRVLKIADPKDIPKLNGWTIQKAEMTAQKGLSLKVSHPAAESDVEVRVSPMVTPYLVGEVMMMGAGILVAAQDLEEKDGKPMGDKV